jgi:hypothetical protein
MRDWISKKDGRKEKRALGLIPKLLKVGSCRIIHDRYNEHLPSFVSDVT